MFDLTSDRRGRVQRPHPFLLENLVFGYLTHNGFSDTAAVVARDVLAGTVQVSASDVEEVQRRQQVPRTVSATVHYCSRLTSICALHFGVIVLAGCCFGADDGSSAMSRA